MPWRTVPQTNREPFDTRYMSAAAASHQSTCTFSTFPPGEDTNRSTRVWVLKSFRAENQIKWMNSQWELQHRL